MTILFAGLVLPFGVHSVSSVPAIRRSLITRMGASGLNSVYSLLAAMGFGLVAFWIVWQFHGQLIGMSVVL